MSDKEIAEALESFKDGNRAPWVERRLSEAYADLSLRVSACHESHERDVRQLSACRDVANELRAALTAAQERERVLRAQLGECRYGIAIEETEKRSIAAERDTLRTALIDIRDKASNGEPFIGDEIEAIASSALAPKGE